VVSVDVLEMTEDYLAFSKSRSVGCGETAYLFVPAVSGSYLLIFSVDYDGRNVFVLMILLINDMLLVLQEVSDKLGQGCRQKCAVERRMYSSPCLLIYRTAYGHLPGPFKACSFSG